MRRRISLISVLLVSMFAIAAAGSFSGVVVKGPIVESGKKWLYVQAARGATRRVEISSARIRLGDDVPANKRTAKPADAIYVGARIRVTATTDADGEWKASLVEIVE